MQKKSDLDMDWKMHAAAAFQPIVAIVMMVVLIALVVYRAYHPFTGGLFGG